MLNNFKLMNALAVALAVVMSGSVFAGNEDSDELLYSGNVDIAAGMQYAQEIVNDIDLNNGSTATAAGRGAVNIPLGGRFSAQVDAQTEFYNRHSGSGQSENENPQGAHMLGVHLSYRNPGIGLFGLFGGTGLGTNSDSDAEGRLGWLGGVEAQGYLGDFTLYGQAGKAEFIVDEESEGFNDGYFGGLEARYFIQENFVVYVNGAYGACNECIDGDDDGDTWNWGGGLKIRVSDSMPIYTTLDYRGGDYFTEDESGDEGREHAVLLGFSFGFGAASLKENDRRGATLSTPMLPARHAAWTETLD